MHVIKQKKKYMLTGHTNMQYKQGKKAKSPCSIS